MTPMPGEAKTSPGYIEAPGARLAALSLMPPENHAVWIVGQLDRVEAGIHARLDRHENAARDDFHAFRRDVEAEFASLREWIQTENAELAAELKERDDKTNKRITTMQGMLVAVFASTTSAAIGLLLNLASG